MTSNCQYFQDIQVILKNAKCLFSLTTHLQQLSFFYFDLDTQIVYPSTGYFFSYTYVKKWENLLSMDLDAI